jgi:hypothetical protein
VTPDGNDGGESAAVTQQATVTQAAVRGADQLARTGPPTGQRTSPQPALPDTGVPATRVQEAVRPTAYQPAVTAVQPTAVQPSTGQQSAVAATRVQAPVQPTTVQPATGLPPGGAGGADHGGTQVLFLGGDSWTTPGMPGGPGDRYGYQRAQQERRRRMITWGALAVGTAAVLAVIAVVVNAMSGSGHSTAQPSATSSGPTAPATSAASSPTPTASSAASFLSDQQSGLSYAQLPAPWQDACPSSLTSNGAFSWTTGESAIAGQVNSGQQTWYGEACSGPLPQQYGYGGVSTLPTTAVNLANTFTNAYYNGLDHTVTTQVSQPIQVSGHAAWEVKFLVTYTNSATQGVTFADEQGVVVVADTGTGLAPAVFFASIPASLGESNVDSLVSSLQLSAAPSAGGSPGDGGSPTADGGGGSPGDGGNGNGNGHGNNP